MQIDYRALLVRYMAVVLENEGINFLPFRDYGIEPWSEDELAELKKISDEASTLNKETS
jgi:hypothetical protein